MMRLRFPEHQVYVFILLWCIFPYNWGAFFHTMSCIWMLWSGMPRPKTNRKKKHEDTQEGPRSNMLYISTRSHDIKQKCHNIQEIFRKMAATHHAISQQHRTTPQQQAQNIKTKSHNILAKSLHLRSHTKRYPSKNPSTDHTRFQQHHSEFIQKTQIQGASKIPDANTIHIA